MVNVRTPYRVSFAGGGTDLLEYSRKFGGAVVGCSINRYITVRLDGNKLFSHSDLLSRSGLGGSAAYLAGAYRAKNPQRQKSDAIQHVTLTENLGQQDQILCVTGGLNAVSFNTDDSYSITHLVPPAWLDVCLSLYYMGDRKVEGKTLLSGINEDALKAQIKLAQQVTLALVSEDFDAFVYNMQEAWEEKKRFRPDLINEHTRIFEKNMDRYGILAFKLCGAGGGGYALLINDPNFKPVLGTPIKLDYEGQVCK
jgi:D-glycero-alpha-D-manno-heptose-7-phosphate kinase